MFVSCLDEDFTFSYIAEASIKFLDVASDDEKWFEIVTKEGTRKVFPRHQIE